MTEVWFYVTDDAAGNARAVLLRRLLERALRSPRRLYVHTRDAAAAERLDEWLWQPETSFLPHSLASAGNASDQQVVIGHGDRPPHQDMLVNLADEIPAFAGQFQRVVELVGGSEQDRVLSRARWTYYRDNGFKVTRHELGT